MFFLVGLVLIKRATPSTFIYVCCLMYVTSFSMFYRRYWSSFLIPVIVWFSPGLYYNCIYDMIVLFGFLPIYGLNFQPLLVLGLAYIKTIPPASTAITVPRPGAIVVALPDIVNHFTTEALTRRRLVSQWHLAGRRCTWPGDVILVERAPVIRPKRKKNGKMYLIPRYVFFGCGCYTTTENTFIQLK